MWVWEVVWVVIPLAWIISRFIIKWQRNTVELEVVRGGNAQAMQEMRDAVLRLEQRVANLERAVMTAEEHRKYAL
jgi:hypothetical protein